METPKTRAHRAHRKGRAAEAYARTDLILDGWTPKRRNQRKGSADFDCTRVDIRSGKRESKTVEVKYRNTPLTKKQRAEKRKAEKEGRVYEVKRVRSLYGYF